MLVYSVDDTDSYYSLQSWVEECMENLWGSSGRDLVWAVIGNKMDLCNEVSPDTVDDFCESIGANLSFTVSAKTGENVGTMFRKIIECLHEHKLKLNNDTTGDSIVLSSSIKKTKCC